MARTCPNCGQPALIGDSVCWHCGQPLQPETSVPKPVLALSNGVNLRLMLQFSLLTVAFVAMLLATTRVLDREPLVLIDGRIAYPPGWQSVTAVDRAFTFDVPQRWAIAQKPAAETADSWTTNPHFLATLQPYNATSAQADLRLVATSSRQFDEASEPGFIQIAYMPQLAAFTAADLLAYVRDNDSAVQFGDGDLVTSIHGSPMPVYIFNVQQDDQTLRCLQQVISAYDTSYLVSGCAPANVYVRYEQEFGHALATFQILEPTGTR